jgi:hypothetical protein
MQDGALGNGGAFVSAPFRRPPRQCTAGQTLKPPSSAASENPDRAAAARHDCPGRHRNPACEDPGGICEQAAGHRAPGNLLRAEQTLLEPRLATAPRPAACILPSTRQDSDPTQDHRDRRWRDHGRHPVGARLWHVRSVPTPRATRRIPASKRVSGERRQINPVVSATARARSRRYHKPDFRCLCCRRRSSWAPARTRFLYRCLCRTGSGVTYMTCVFPLLAAALTVSRLTGSVRQRHVTAAGPLVTGTFRRRLQITADLDEVTARVFTREEQAQNHVQAGNIAVSVRVILSWLDSIGRRDSQAGLTS